MKSKTSTIITALVLCLGANYALAQESEKAVLWGLKAAVDVELPGKWHGEHATVPMYKAGSGFQIGGVSNIYLGRNFYFEPGVSLFYSQYRYKDLLLTGNDGQWVENDPKIYKWGVEVPLVVGYTFGITEYFSMNVFTGPQLRYAFAGEIVIKDPGIQEDLKNYSDLWGINGQHRFDCSWKIGVGFPINNFNFAIEADLGITDLLKGAMKFRENRLGAALTYYF